MADTSVQTTGLNNYEAYGDDDTMLVQNGPRGNQLIPDAFILMEFDLGDLPFSDTNSIQSVQLQLYHIPADRNRGAATLTVRRLPSTRLDVETLHGGFFETGVPEDSEGIFGPNFSVSPSDEILQVDVTSIVKASGFEDNQVLLAIQNTGAEQPSGAEGDRFYSRETLDPPQLIVQY